MLLLARKQSNDFRKLFTNASYKCKFVWNSTIVCRVDQSISLLISDPKGPHYPFWFYQLHSYFIIYIHGEYAYVNYICSINTSYWRYVWCLKSYCLRHQFWCIRIEAPICATHINFTLQKSERQKESVNDTNHLQFIVKLLSSQCSFYFASLLISK